MIYVDIEIIYIDIEVDDDTEALFGSDDEEDGSETAVEETVESDSE